MISNIDQLEDIMMLKVPQVQTEGFIKIARLCNNFYAEGSTRPTCRPFMIDGKQVGLLRPEVIQQLKNYPDIFEIIPGTDLQDTKHVLLHRCLQQNIRDSKVAEVLEDLRRRDVFPILRGWRDEKYFVWHKFHEPPLLRMERSATCLFGIKQYGVHINAYVGDHMWIATRSKSKPTWPGMKDQMVAGGLAAGQTIMECAYKECKEEASVPDELISRLKPAGAVSYFYENEKGLYPEVQFVMDLEVPNDFVPVNADGEVERFELIPFHKVKELMLANAFKFNCGLVCLDFMIRHGHILPDNEEYYTELVQKLHTSLP